MVDTGLGVQESLKGERPTLIDTSRSAIVFNSRVAKQPEVLAALEDWVKFFNTDEELSYFTVNSNMARPLDYQVKEEHKVGWNQFGTSLWELRKDSYVLRFDCNNETFYSNTSFFARGFQDGAFACHLNNVEVMGRDVSIVSTHENSLNPVIRSIIDADNPIDVASTTVRFSLKAHKTFLFDAETEERIRFEEAE
jgi:hypothetical protein